MSDNGANEILKVTLNDGSMSVKFGDYNVALLSHALRLANLQLDNLLIGKEVAKEASKIQIATSIINKLRG